MLASIHRIQNDEPRIVDPAVRIFKRLHEFWAQWLACWRVFQIDGERGRQQFAATDVVVEEQAKAHEPRRTNTFLMRQDEPKRPDDMGRNGPKPLALNQRFPHQRKFIMLKIAKPTMDKFR